VSSKNVNVLQKHDGYTPTLIKSARCVYEKQYVYNRFVIHTWVFGIL